MQSVLLVLSLVTACAVPSGAPAERAPRILFVGNSLTYVNDLPAMVKAVASDAGLPVPETEMVAFPDFGLEDHWSEGTARRRLEEARWSYVVLQQGPSSLSEGRESLITWTEQFAPLIRAAGAEPVLFMVWPSRDRLAFFPQVRDSYRDAAAGVGGIFAPAGEAWRLALAGDAAVPVYGSDEFHPSRAGTYLAAVVILARLTALDVARLPATIPGAANVPASTVRKLQQAAAESLRDQPARP